MLSVSGTVSRESVIDPVKIYSSFNLSGAKLSDRTIWLRCIFFLDVMIKRRSSLEQKKELGLFEVASGTVVISDPCYERGTWCAGELAVKKGTWKAFVIFRDNRVGELLAYHTSINLSTLKGWEMLPFEVGVDSGQAGIFDDIVYARDDDAWYRSCSAITLKAPGAGVLKNGVVAESGHGDGSYNCYTSKLEGEIIAIKIIFISGRKL